MAEPKQKGEPEKFIDNEDVRPAETRSHAMASTPEHVHEGSDVAIAPIAKFLVVLFAGLGVTHLVLWGLFELLESRRAEHDKPRSPVADTVRRYREPALQENPYLDLDAFIKEQDSAMNSYGWVDSTGRVAHIPIDSALEMVARTGLPSRGRTVVIDSAQVRRADSVVTGEGAAPARQ